MADASYRIAPIFLIRIAGVPFEILAKLATFEIATAAREFLFRQAKLLQAKVEAKQSLMARRHEFSNEQFRVLRKALRAGIRPPGTDLPTNISAACWQGGAEVAEAEADLNRSLARDLDAARASLFDAARRYLPPYLVFAAEGVRERVIRQLADVAAPLPPRNKQARADERHLVLYLQRVAGKNDSLSEFGPEGWGTVDSKLKSLKLTPQAGIARREVFLERWTAHGAAAAINADPLTRDEFAPRLHPHGRIERDQFINTETGETIPLDPELRALLARCDGATPAHSLGVSAHLLAELASQNLIRWEMEVCALDPHAFDVLLADVARWRDGPVRTRWLEALQPLAALAGTFAGAAEPMSRLALIEEATERLKTLGAHKTATRFLYSATNPIGEECFRETNFSISEDLINEVARDAAPWIDLWRDNYAFVASRVAAGLRGLLESARLQDDSIPLPAFLRHCAQMQMPLTGPGMIAFAHNAFREVKAAFTEQLHLHADQAEYELTAADCQFVRREFVYDRFAEYTYPSADLQLGAHRREGGVSPAGRVARGCRGMAAHRDDCHFVRKNFQYPKFDEYTYPSADMQLSAKSAEAVARGEYEWVLAELHPPVALLHHGFYWGCPDKEALGRALASTTKGRPTFHFGFFAIDFTATTAVRVLDAMPGLTNFVAPQRGDPRWRIIPPAEIEVFRRRGERRRRFAHARGRANISARSRAAWVIPLGFHPFLFGRSPHMPRLRCGKVIVQRRSWTVSLEELPAGNYTGVSRNLVAAIERLRAAKGWPRYIYIRPSEQALRRSGAEGRDKDTKPVFIDLESYLFLEIFHGWLTKAGELEVSEMLPDPEHLLWQEKDGRRTFELRTQIVPG